MSKSSLLSEFLSTHEEVHAFVHGVYAGLTEWKGLDDKTLANPDVILEIHYAKGGYVLGTVIRVMIILLIGKSLIP